jgi:hypothetical protein
MLHNERRILRFWEYQNTPFIIDNATVHISASNGSTEEPLVLVSPPESAKEHELSAEYVGSHPGILFVEWMVFSGGEQTPRPEIYFVAWTDVYARIRNLMGDSNDRLREEDIDPALASAYRKLLRQYPCVTTTLGGYANLSLPDQIAFDEALSITAAGVLAANPSIIALLGNTTITKLTLGPIEKTRKEGVDYKQVQGHATSAASEAMKGVSCVAVSLEEARSGMGGLGGVHIVNPTREEAARDPGSLFGKMFYPSYTGHRRGGRRLR